MLIRGKNSSSPILHSLTRTQVDARALFELPQSGKECMDSGKPVELLLASLRIKWLYIYASFFANGELYTKRPSCTLPSWVEEYKSGAVTFSDLSGN